VVNVRPTSDGEVARSAVTCGKAGVYMSVANGGTALCRASVRISAVVTVAVPAVRPASALVEREPTNRREQSSQLPNDRRNCHSDRGRTANYTCVQQMLV
jgi:hypothetical protein